MLRFVCGTAVYCSAHKCFYELIECQLLVDAPKSLLFHSFKYLFHIFFLSWILYKMMLSLHLVGIFFSSKLYWKKLCFIF